MKKGKRSVGSGFVVCLVSLLQFYGLVIDLMADSPRCASLDEALCEDGLWSQADFATSATSFLRFFLLSSQTRRIDSGQTQKDQQGILLPSGSHLTALFTRPTVS